MSKVFLVDIDRCNGCRNCQIACKDEHCEQPWLPYTSAQPMTGHFWMNVTEKVRGQVPVVKISYIPVMCTHCEDAPCKKVGGDAVYTRNDGLVIIDPTKAKGKKELVGACPLGAIYWNEALNLPQKCTGCAHLLDNGWDVPRCVDACPTEALVYVEENNVLASEIETLEETNSYGPHVLYRNLPKRFVAGMIINTIEDEVSIGSHISLENNKGEEVASTTTDEFGDFCFNLLDRELYTIVIRRKNSHDIRVDADLKEKDIYIGEIDIA